MKPTVTQLYATAATILNGLLSDHTIDLSYDEMINKAVDLAQRLAEKVPETDLLPEPDNIRKFLAQVFAEVNGRPIAKSQMQMLICDRLHTGKRNAENIMMWAESNKLLNADVNGNGVRYTLA